jgi:hypothetical protein
MLLVNDNPIIEGFHLKNCMEKVHRDLMVGGSYYHQLLLDSGSEGYLLEVSRCGGKGMILKFGAESHYSLVANWHRLAQFYFENLLG